MDFRLSEEQQKWRYEVRGFLEEAMTPAFRAELADTEGGELLEGPEQKRFWANVAERGWLGMNWPKEYGGLERSALDQLTLLREFARYGAPALPLTITSIAPTIMRFGTEDNKRTWIPRIISGEVTCALGYSEPGAGTDLASLETRAVLDGDEWVINGQKIWNTHGHIATHEWLGVRTDPDAPKHKGISVIMVPTSSPGIEIQPIWTWGDMRTNQIYLDNVRVPKENLIGELNRGWYYIASALDLERVAIGAYTAQVEAIFDDLVAFCRRTVIDGQVLAQRPEVRAKLAELDRDLEIARLFATRTASMIDAGEVPNKEASMQKFYGTELQTKVTDWGMQIVSLYGQLDRHDPLAPLQGALEKSYRTAPPGRFGGGTNEIQRSIVAQRGLGLPR